MENREKIVIKLNNLLARAEQLSPEELNRIFGGGGALAGTHGLPGTSCDTNCACLTGQCIKAEGESEGVCA